jgi:hypothetical protein
MPQPTYTALATVTLGSSASSVTFSSIPATYRDLIFISDGAASSSTNIAVRFNSDTGNNYNYVAMFGGSGGASSYAESNQNSFTQLSLSTSISNNIAQIMDYSATDKHKTLLVRGNGDSGYVTGVAGRWANTAAITSISLAPTIGGATFNTGTVFSLYGVIA